MKILVTGCLGFIGSYFVRYILNNYEDIEVIGINRNSNVKNRKRLEHHWNNLKFTMYFADFARDNITEAFRDVDVVVHFGAKTFVDYSIRDPQPFIESNVVGTYKILAEVRKSRTVEHYFQISTDEVYGSILEGKYKEDSRPNPSNPYAATKMAADSLVLSYHNSYGINTIITRTENNYGEYQGVEKVFPVFVKKDLMNELLPVYGDGQHKRMWLYVEDHCSAIIHLLKHGKAGEIYHVACEEEFANIELAKKILRIFLTQKGKLFIFFMICSLIFDLQFGNREGGEIPPQPRYCEWLQKL